MKQLGCFEITPDFYDLRNRPINLLPQDRVLIDTKFKLYTRVHPMEEDFLDANDPEDIKESQIDSKRKTIFIVHGFFDNTLYGKWMEVSCFEMFKHIYSYYFNHNMITQVKSVTILDS